MKLKSLDSLLIFGSVAVIILIFSFPEVYLFEVFGYVFGGIGTLYLLEILRSFISNRMNFDWYLVKDNFIRKVACLALVVPFIIMGGINLLSDKSVSEVVAQEMMEYDGNYNMKPVETEQHSLLWNIISYYLNPGADDNATQQLGNIWTVVISVFSFILLNSMLISALVGWLSKRRRDWEKGEVRYDWFRNIGRNRFAVVIGTNEVVTAVIKNLLTKNEDGEINFKCEGNNEYVILQTDRKVGDVRDELSVYLSDDELKKVVIYKALRNSKSELKKLHLKNATEIYVLGESTLQNSGETNHDAMNMRCVNLITEILREEKYEGRKVCKVMFEYQTTYSVFQFSDISNDIKEKLVFIPFNRCESWARKVIVESFSEDSLGNRIEYTPLDGKDGISKDSEEHVHFVVVGMSKMGVAMGVQALSQAHYINYAAAENIEDAKIREEKKNKARSRITFIDSNADNEMCFFRGRYANLFALARHRYIDANHYTVETKEDAIPWVDPMSEENCLYRHLSRDGQNFLDVEVEFVKGELESDGVRKYLCDISKKDIKSKLTIAICLTQTHQAVAASLYMPIEVYEKAHEIWVYQRESSDIIRNLENTQTKDRRYKKLRPFGMLFGEYMSDRAHYLKALLVNWAYNAERECLGWPVSMTDDKDEYVHKIKKSWRELRLDKQWSNRNFVDYIDVKKRSVGFDVVKNLKLHPEEDLLLGISEHNRWNVEQLLFGCFPCVEDLDKIFERINKEGMNDSVSNEYEEWKQKNNISKTEYRKIKDDVKESEYRIHPNICEFEHLDKVDSGAKDYDSMLNNAIVKILDLVDGKTKK